MSQELENANETAMQTMSDDDRAILEQARNMNAPRQAFVRFDTMKFKDSEKKVEGLTRGNYFIESYNPDLPEGKRKTYRDIGPNPEVVILHSVSTYSYYKEDEGLQAWTSDIQNTRDSDEMVQLFSYKTGKAALEVTCSYWELKMYLAQNYTLHHPDGSAKKLMTFQTLLYVLFEGKVYRFFVSNASKAGIAPGEKGGDFARPQPKSLIDFENSTKADNKRAALCEFVCRLGSWFKDDVEQPFYVKTFENIGENPFTILALRELKAILMEVMRQKRDMTEKNAIAELGQETTEMDPQEIEVIDTRSDQLEDIHEKAKNLPF